MTDSEIQYFLDVLLPYSDKQKRSKTSENKLNEKTKKRLYGIARRLCYQATLLKANSKRILTALKDIVSILDSIGYNQNMTSTVRTDSKRNIIYRIDLEENLYLQVNRSLFSL